MAKVRFYYCPVCGNIIEKVIDSGNDLECCGRTMIELLPGITDGKTEWHVPYCEVKNNKVYVRIGKHEHPMESDHFIEWVEMVTGMGIARRYFQPGDVPETCFGLCEDEELESIYAFCNKHKLWQLKIK